MPSIKSMFLGPEAEDPNFNLDDFLREADAAADASPASQYSEMGVTPEPTEPPTAPVAEAEPVSTGEETGETVEPTGEAAVPAEPVAPPTPVDPLASLPPERRSALLLLDEAMTTDPEIREKVFTAIRPEPPAPRPTLPEHVDPESFEAQLWQQNQQILDRLDQEKTERTQQAAAQAQSNRLAQAATVAGQNIGTKYNLEPEEVLTLAQRAGASGLPQALVSRPGADPTASYEEALEHALFMDPVLRARAVGESAPQPPVLGPTPERTEKKRVLHALSGAATPVAGPPPARAALETRSDGRLTPGSRALLVDELATTLRSRGGAE